VVVVVVAVFIHSGVHGPPKRGNASVEALKEVSKRKKIATSFVEVGRCGIGELKGFLLALR